MMPFVVSKDYEKTYLRESAEKKLVDSLNRYLIYFGESGNIPPHNGLGALADALECTTTSELNGSYELYMRYPLDGINGAGIENGCLLLAPNAKDGVWQPYRVYRITTPINGIVSIYARHIVQTDLAGIPCKPFAADDAPGAISRINRNALIPTGFDFSTDKTTSGRFEVAHPTAILSIMGGMDGSILDVFGGEWEYNGTNAILHNRLGADNGVRFAYGLNMVDFEQDANIADCYTAAIGYWDNEGNSVYTDIIPVTGNHTHTRVATVDLSSAFEQMPSKEMLTLALRSYMADNSIGVPKVSIKLSFVDLSQVAEYAHINQSVGLGDTVTVGFSRIGIDTKARIVKTIWDVLAGRYAALEIGSVRANIADTIASQQAAIDAKPSETTATQIAGNVAQSIMGAKGGAVRLVDKDGDGMPDELYIADSPIPAQASKVWRFNYQGWAASRNGYNGPYSMSATFDYGIIAEMLTATTSRTFAAANYSQTDVDRIGEILLGTITPTSADFDKYDFYGKEKITINDMVICQSIVNSGADLVLEWTVSITPSGNAINVHVKKSGAQTGEFDAFSAGTFGVKCNGMVVESVDCSGPITADKITCRELWVNGHQIT